MLGNDPPDGGFDRFESLHANDNLAVWLQDTGYRTGLVGKYLNGYIGDPPVPPGWSEWYAAAPATQRVYDYDLDQNGTQVHYGTEADDFKQDVLTDRAIDFVDRNEFERRVGSEHASATLDHIDRSITASIERARSTLGYAPRYSSLEALRESLRWLVEHGQADVAGQAF